MGEFLNVYRQHSLEAFIKNWKETMKSLIKNAIRKVFNFFGFEIYRKNNESRKRDHLIEVLEHVSKIGFKPQTVIDVGVAYGTHPLYEKFPDAKHLLIEPLKEYEKYIIEISQKYDADYVFAAAGAKSGKIVINVHPDLVGSSIFKEVEGDPVNGLPREVPVVTLDELCDKKNSEGPYLIKIDTQGAELEVLDGAKKILADIEIIILEAHLFQFFINGPQFYDVITYMKKNGFVVYDITGTYYRPLDNALAGVDLTFVKEDGKFRRFHSFATPEQRDRLTKKLLRSF